MNYTEAQLDRIATISDIIMTVTGNDEHPINEIYDAAYEGTAADMDLAAEAIFKAELANFPADWADQYEASFDF